MPDGVATKFISTVPSRALIGTAGSIVNVWLESENGPGQMAWKGSYHAPSNWQGIRTGFTDFHEPTLPSYALLNARISYDVPLNIGRDHPLRLSIFGNNLLDKRPEETMVFVAVAQRFAGLERTLNEHRHFFLPARRTS